MKAADSGGGRSALGVLVRVCAPITGLGCETRICRATPSAKIHDFTVCVWLLLQTLAIVSLAICAWLTAGGVLRNIACAPSSEIVKERCGRMRAGFKRPANPLPSFRLPRTVGWRLARVVAWRSFSDCYGRSWDGEWRPVPGPPPKRRLSCGQGSRFPLARGYCRP